MEVFKFIKNGIRKVIGLLTNSSPLRRHLTIVGVEDDLIVEVAMIAKKLLCTFFASEKLILLINLST